MRYVLDASVAASWFFEDESSKIADLAFELLEDGFDAVTPALFWFELRNAVHIGQRRNRITADRAAAVFSRLDQAIILYDVLPKDGIAIFALARRHRLTFYDACYLELAQREGISLATLDKTLAQTAIAEGVALIGTS